MGHDNMTISEAREKYINYTYENNTKRVKEAEIRYIEQRYATDIKGWDAAYTSRDGNEYNIIENENEKTQKAKEKGGKQIRKEGGYHGDEKKEKVKSDAVSGTLNAVGGAAAVTNVGLAGAGATGKLVIESSSSISGVAVGGAKGGFTGAMEALRTGGGKACFIIGCILALASGVASWAMRPEEKKQVDALVKMGLYMQETTTNEILQKEDEMDAMQAEIEEQLVYAEENNEELRSNIESQMADSDKNNTAISDYNAKISDGTGLTKEEADNYKILAEKNKETSENVTAMEETSQAELGEIYDGIGERAEEFDNVAVSISVSQGQVEETGDMAKTVNKALIGDMVGQVSNIASGSWSAAQAFAFAPLTFGASAAFGAMALAGVALSVARVIDLGVMMKDISDVNGQKDDLADTNVEATDLYATHLDEYDAQLGYMENMVHEQPEEFPEMEMAEELEPVLTQDPSAQGGTGSNPFASGNDKKPYEKV